VRLPDLVEERRLQLHFSFYNLQMTSEGLLLSDVTKDELWLIDPQTLQYIRRMHKVGRAFVTAAAGSSLGYATAMIQERQNPPRNYLVRYDFAAWKATMYPNKQGLSMVAMTPDGRFLLVENNYRNLQRWRITEKGLDLRPFISTTKSVSFCRHVKRILAFFQCHGLPGFRK
jgi:hypothetical protein